MTHMDTTPGAEYTEESSDMSGAGADGDHAEALQDLRDIDPAHAPDPAERLAAELADALEGVSPEAMPEQLAAPFAGDGEEAP